MVTAQDQWLVVLAQYLRHRTSKTLGKTFNCVQTACGQHRLRSDRVAPRNGAARCRQGTGYAVVAQ
jgi:hypothetical protein